MLCASFRIILIIYSLRHANLYENAKNVMNKSINVTFNVHEVRDHVDNNQNIYKLFIYNKFSHDSQFLTSYQSHIFIWHIRYTKGAGYQLALSLLLI